MTNLQQATQKLIAAGQQLYAQGMVPATSGNFSARLDDGTMAITVSGRHKGRLEAGAGLDLDGVITQLQQWMLEDKKSYTIKGTAGAGLGGGL